MQTDHPSPYPEEQSQTFRPALAEMFLYMAVMLILSFAALLVFGLSPPKGASTGTAAIYMVVLFGIWLVALPAVQYVAITRFSGGTKPHLRWSTGYPVVFGPWHAPGAVLAKKRFAMVCALPALCVVAVLLPVGALAFRAGVETLHQVVIVIASGVSLYFLRYTFWALSRPQGARIEVLQENGLVREVE